ARDAAPAITKKQEEPSELPEPILTKQDFLRILADKGVLPDYLVKDKRMVIRDTDVHIKSHDPIVCIRWKDGVLEQTYVQKGMPISINSPKAIDVPVADVVSKEELVRSGNIHGSPIPDGEVARGAAVTENAVRGELKLWRILSDLRKHAIPEEEEEEYIREFAVEERV
ncbi:unnamed protein product, partial [marine sediment metagenome]